jgi:hypothetical protein
LIEARKDELREGMTIKTDEMMETKQSLMKGKLDQRS